MDTKVNKYKKYLLYLLSRYKVYKEIILKLKLYIKGNNIKWLCFLILREILIKNEVNWNILLTSGKEIKRDSMISVNESR